MRIVPFVLAALAGSSALARPEASPPPLLTFRPDPAPAAPETAPQAAGSQPALAESLKLPGNWWTVQIDPVMWYVAPAGDLRLPVNSGTGPGAFTTQGSEIDLNDFDMDQTRLSPAGSIQIAGGPWRFGITGANYSVDRTVTSDVDARVGSVVLATGDQVAVDFNFSIFEFTAGYRLWNTDLAKESAHPENAVSVQMDLYLVFGASLYDVDISMTSVASAAESDYAGTFVQPIIGARFEAEFDEHFGLTLQVTGGGLPLDSQSSACVDVAVGFQWRPIRNVGVLIGWRQAAFWLSDGDGLDEFTYNGTLAGLFAGLTIRF